MVNLNHPGAAIINDCSRSRILQGQKQKTPKQIPLFNWFKLVRKAQIFFGSFFFPRFAYRLNCDKIGLVFLKIVCLFDAEVL